LLVASEVYSLFGRPYRIVDYLLLAGLVWEKNTVPGWKFTIVYEQANRLLILICKQRSISSPTFFFLINLLMRIHCFIFDQKFVCILLYFLFLYSLLELSMRWLFPQTLKWSCKSSDTNPLVSNQHQFEIEIRWANLTSSILLC